MKKQHYGFIYLMTIGLLSLSSCAVDIDPNAANSMTAILAILLEYIWVIIVLLVSILFRFAFITGIGLTIWSTLHLFIGSQTFDNSLLGLCLCCGILMCMIGLILTPKIQLPYVRISNKPLPAQPENKNVFCWKTKLYEGIIGLIFAVIAEIIIRAIP